MRVAPVMFRVWTKPPKIARWQRWARGYQIEIVRDVTPEFDALAGQQFMIRRDAQYLRWRYLQHPDVSYLFLALRRWRTLVGWSVFRIVDGRVLWIDGLGSTDILLRQVAGGREIVCWSPGEVPGFEARPEPQDLGVMCVPFTMPDAAARMAARFHYAMGDSDLF